jgi:PTH1 family peptidyl-tRNA hydrolase
MIELAAFLGNPGPEYAGNRHNAGWLMAAKLPFYNSLTWHNKFKGRYAEKEGSRFIMPLTFMNLSGEAAGAAASFFKIPPEHIIVVHDELELPLGTISLKYSGGLGGHNGLRSLKANLGSADFWRIRIGIGRPGDRLPGEGGPPGSGKGVYEWVLSDFTREEAPALEAALDAAAGLLIEAMKAGPESLLPAWSKKDTLTNQR